MTDRSGDAGEAKQSRGSLLRELPVLLLVALLLAFLLRTFVVQVFYIPSSSMEPTLNINDRMLVEKITYRFRDPQRGEIVVFEGEASPLPEEDAGVGGRLARGLGQFLGVVPTNARDLVKRVIGVPGDEILIEDGRVFVNGVGIDEPYVVFDDRSDFGPVTVPEGALFFLGDNRPNSSDSRRSLGFVPMDQVIGRSLVTIWPPDSMRSLTRVGYDLPSASEAQATSSAQAQVAPRSDASAPLPGVANAASVRSPAPTPALALDVASGSG